MDVPWTRWKQDDLPCQYNDEQARENAEFLQSILGADWLSRGTSSPGWQHHRILEFWRTAGACAFLELNALADDLRQVQEVQGVPEVVRDLKASGTCKSAWHTIHSAAMFARSGTCKVSRFFPQDDRSYPDFELSRGALTAVVEAKILRRSEDHNAHSRLSKTILRSFEGRVGIDPSLWPPTVLVVSQLWPHTTPPEDVSRVADDIVQAMVEGIRLYNGVDIVLKRRTFTVVMGDPFGMLPGASDSRCLMVVAPTSPVETSRIIRLAGKASKQLRSYAEQGQECIFFLGIGQLHEPQLIHSRLSAEFSKRMSPISAVYLNITGTWCQAPKRTKIDIIGCIPNPRAIVCGDLKTRIRTVGTGHPMFRIAAAETEVPVYQFASCVAVDGASEVQWPDVREIPAQWLEGIPR